MNPQKTSTTGLCNTMLVLRNKDLYNSVEYKKVTEEIENQKKRLEKNPENLDKLALIFTSRCLSLDDLVSLESDKADQIFDSKLAEADAFIQKNQALAEKLPMQNPTLSALRISPGKRAAAPDVSWSRVKLKIQQGNWERVEGQPLHPR